MTKEQVVIEAAKKWCVAMNALHGEFLLAQHQLLKAVEALILAAPMASAEAHWCLTPDPVGNASMCAALSPDGKHRCTYGAGHPISHHCCYPHLWPAPHPTAEADLFTPAERAAQGMPTAVEAPRCRNCAGTGGSVGDNCGRCRGSGREPSEPESLVAVARDVADYIADNADRLPTGSSFPMVERIARAVSAVNQAAPPSRAGQGERGALERVRDWAGRFLRDIPESEGIGDFRGIRIMAQSTIDMLNSELSALPASPSREAEAELLAAAKAALRELHLCRSQSVVVGALEAAIAKAGGA